MAAIGVVTPGLMDIKAGLILDPPNLKPWRNVPVRDHIKQAFGKPTVYQNDANAAAYGEFWVGARPTISDVELELGVTGRHIDELEAAAAKDAGEVTVRLVRDADAELTARLDTARTENGAAAEGLEFRLGDARSGNTSDAHRLVHLGAAHGLQDAVKERLMRAYQGEGDLMSDRAALERLGTMPEHELAIADLLEPLYRQAGDFQKLIGAHEVQVRRSDDVTRKVELLHQVANPGVASGRGRGE